MMSTLFVYDESVEGYRLSQSHPLQPERFSLAVALLRSWRVLETGSAVMDAGITGPSATLRAAVPATDNQLLLGHSREYIDFVRTASREPGPAMGHGIGFGDTPAFRGMHEAAALVVGATTVAVDAVAGAVASGDERTACNLAGGMHHARYDSASGFCIYNDAVVAIRAAQLRHPGLRVAYLDIDAHHGDGVEAAFAQNRSVLTISVHESGRYLFPGTGDPADTGLGAGEGTAVNVPLPMGAGKAAYRIAWERVARPALEAFEPDLIVLQAGADSHANDPLTHLRQTVSGFYDLVSSVVDASRIVCSGRLVLLGGGGYRPFDEVPRMWAAATCALIGRPVPADLPPEWLEFARQIALERHAEPCAVMATLEEGSEVEPEADSVLRSTAQVAETVRQASPLLRGSAACPVSSLEEELADLVDREIDAGC